MKRMKNAVWRNIWESAKNVPMLFVTIGVFILLVILSLPALSAFAAWRLWIVVALVIVTVGDTLIGMIEDIKNGHVGLDVLAVVAIISALAVGEYWASWTVVLMIYSGSVIEAYAQSSAKHNLTMLMKSAPSIAHRFAGGNAEGSDIEDVDVSEVQVMDLLLVKPGETVPVDGVVMSDRAVVNLSMINGEPLPQTVRNAQRVPSGAINDSESFTLRATAAAADSQYQRILSLVEAAQNSRPASVRTADLLAVPFTVVAFTLAGIAWFLSGNPVRFAEVLVLATPCPLLIAAPVAYLGGTSRLAASGVLVKGQEIIEQLTKVTQIFFDKTGTLTVKQPQVVRVERAHDERANLWNHISDDMLLSAVGVVESYSIHILAQGIASAGKKARDRVTDEQLAQFDVDDVSQVVERSGMGVTAQVSGHTVKVGRFAFVLGEAPNQGFKKSNSSAPARKYVLQANEQKAPVRGTLPDVAKQREDAITSHDIFSDLEPASMAAYVSIDGDVVGRIILRDVPRANAADTVKTLRDLGVTHISMLTGDSQDSAYRIAEQVGINQKDVYTKLLPENKQRILHNSRQNTHAITMMVGDGVNDAPVLASADIGVAITDGSSTAASETAHMVIMNDDVSLIPKSILIARRTQNVMYQAVIIGLALATIGMIVASFGVIPAVLGAFGQEAIDVISIMWALNAVRDKK
ncbi:heavy metal translocating P-type ATPase [Alloscardovia criceti]|uniref:heavy metal translocating P-type ATPase n=1 Tax=Alloscardovia criceti TaxID=356828 RepID=UPI0004773F0E